MCVVRVLVAMFDLEVFLKKQDALGFFVSSDVVVKVKGYESTLRENLRGIFRSRILHLLCGKGVMRILRTIVKGSLGMTRWILRNRLNEQRACFSDKDFHSPCHG